MSIAEGIIRWIQGYSGDIEIADEISVDQLLAKGEGIGLFRAPGDELTQYIGGARTIRSHFLILICRPSQTDELRVKNQEWLESFERWIRSRNRARELPELGDGRICFSVQIENSFAAQEQSESETIYQINIAVEYYEEG